MRPSSSRWYGLCLTALIAVPAYSAFAFESPPTTRPSILLNLPQTGTDETKIDYATLPVLKGTHIVVSPSHSTWKFQLHNYLVRHGNRFFCMWSRGPGEDQATQYISWSTSDDGLKWAEHKVLVGPPAEGYGYIARGFWERDNELLALVASFRAPGAFGVNKDLKLQAYAYDAPSDSWKFRGIVFDNAINNFAPEKLPNGQWMMTRRDARFNVTMLIGGVKGIDDWSVVPVVQLLHNAGNFRPDEPIWWLNPDKTIVGLFRDNGGSSRLFLSTSADQGQHWSTPALTNFPNATSKLYSLRTSDGCRVLISNANPKLGRRQLHLSTSDDGHVFNHMALLDIPSSKATTFQYPHAIEHEGRLLIAFSQKKTSIEILSVPLEELKQLRAR